MLNSVSIRERRKEYAILTAIGHSPASLKVRLFLESLYQGIAGWILGLLAGGAVLSLFEDRFFTPNGLYIGDSAVSSYLHVIYTVHYDCSSPDTYRKTSEKRSRRSSEEF
jgi:putative ABC transport system permease protein